MSLRPNITIHRTVKKLRFLPSGDFQRYAALIEMEIENEQTN